MRIQPRSTALVTLAGVAVAGVLAAGCGSAHPARHRAPRLPGVHGVAAVLPAADPRPYGAADAAFGLGLLSAWCRQAPRANIVFSPESVATGLGMAYLGARGATARAMAGVLHLPAVGRALLAGLQARTNALRGLTGPAVTVASGDQVWADPSLSTRRDYLNDVATGYGAAAGVRQVPLLTRPARAAAQIDAAISAATRGHIPRLLSGRDLTDIGWVLTDALYLNARWATPFQAYRTAAGRFTTASSQRVSAKFLNGAGYVSDRADGWTAVALPYRGGRLSMIALLPDSASGGCPALTAPALASISQALASGARPHGKLAGQGGIPTKTRQSGQAGGGVSAETAISLPRVSLHSRIKLNGLLSQLGMGIGFTDAADFSGLTPQPAKLGFVIHAASLQVAERGTVASAATAVGIMPTSGELSLRTVTFNRPYLLVVTSNATGEPLFLARVADPLQS